MFATTDVITIPTQNLLNCFELDSWAQTFQCIEVEMDFLHSTDRTNRLYKIDPFEIQEIPSSYSFKIFISFNIRFILKICENQPKFFPKL